MANDSTWVMEIPFDYVFSVFVVFMVAFIVRMLWRAYRLTRSDWKDLI